MEESLTVICPNRDDATAARIMGSDSGVRIVVSAFTLRARTS
jgi:hypothetical protein